VSVSGCGQVRLRAASGRRRTGGYRRSPGGINDRKCEAELTGRNCGAAFPRVHADARRVSCGSRNVSGVPDIDRLVRVRSWPLLVAAIGSAALGVLAGALRLTAVEPHATFVDCGPAVFGRPSPLPDASCGPAYNQLPVPLTFLTFGLVGISIALVVGAIMIQWVRWQAKPGQPDSVRMETDNP
jgi:hypothetical protein